MLAVLPPSGRCRCQLCSLYGPGYRGVLWLKRQKVLSYWHYVILAAACPGWRCFVVCACRPRASFHPSVHAAREARSRVYSEREDAARYQNRSTRLQGTGPDRLFFSACSMPGYRSAASLRHRIVFAGLLSGKPVGIMLMTFAGIKMGCGTPAGDLRPHPSSRCRGRHRVSPSRCSRDPQRPPGGVRTKSRWGALFASWHAPLAIAIGRASGARMHGAQKAAPIPCHDRVSRSGPVRVSG